MAISLGQLGTAAQRREEIGFLAHWQQLPFRRYLVVVVVVVVVVVAAVVPQRVFLFLRGPTKLRGRGDRRRYRATE